MARYRNIPTIRHNGTSGGWQLVDHPVLEPATAHGDWTADAGTLTTESTIVPPGQATCLKLVSGVNAAAQITRTWASDNDLGGCYPMELWVYNGDGGTATCQVVVSTTDSLFVAHTYTTGNTTLVPGWNLLRFHAGAWTNNAADWQYVRGLRFIRAAGGAGVATTTYIGAFSYACTDQSMGTLICDDAFATVMDIAPIMETYGLKGGAVAMATDLIDTAGYLTTAQLNTLHDTYGWDILLHGKTHTNFVSGGLNQAQMEAELSSARATFATNGWTRNGEDRVLVYVGGGVNSTVKAACAAQGVVAGIRDWQSNVNWSSNAIGANPWEVCRISISEEGPGVATVISTWMNAALQKSSNVLFMGHRFPVALSGDTYECTIADFTTLCKFAAKMVAAGMLKWTSPTRMLFGRNTSSGAAGSGGTSGGNWGPVIEIPPGDPE